MSIFRSYFKTNASLIRFSEINNSQNPVTEISYGTLNNQVSRFIFSIDVTDLKARITAGLINPDIIQKHVLKMTNTIAYRSDLLGRKSYDGSTDRASSFSLELFNIDQEWDEGSGYDFIYDENFYPLLPKQAVNWYDRKTSLAWATDGAYVSGVTGSTILGTQHFIKGNENLELDITDYVNHLLQLSGVTGFTGTTYGLGIKFTDFYETGTTANRQAVAFHTKYTNTFFEPFVETTYNDLISDDRNKFYQGKDNELYLYSNVGGDTSDITVSGVTIYNSNGEIVDIINQSGVTRVQKGVYKISLNVETETSPDRVLFSDVWTIIQNGKLKNVEQEFYIIPTENYFSFSLDNRLNFDDFYFTYSGIKSDETLRSGANRRIKVNTKTLYSQNNALPLNLEYRIFTTQGEKYQIDIVPYSKVNRTSHGYEFNLDTSWLIPQDYYLELRINDGDNYAVKSPLKFTIANEGLL